MRILIVSCWLCSLVLQHNHIIISNLFLFFFSPKTLTNSRHSYVNSREVGILKELLHNRYYRLRYIFSSCTANTRNMELLLFFLINFWRRAIFCIAFQALSFATQKFLTSLKYLLTQWRWLLLFLAGRDLSKPQPPDVPGTVVCLEPWGGRRRKMNPLHASKSKYRVKVPAWAALSLGGKGRIQTILFNYKNQSKHYEK